MALVFGGDVADRARAAHSFRRLADLGADTVCFGHGRPLTGPDVDRLTAAARAAVVPDPLGTG